MASRWIGSFFLLSSLTRHHVLPSYWHWRSENAKYHHISLLHSIAVPFSLTNAMKILIECPSDILTHLMLTKIDNDGCFACFEIRKRSMKFVMWQKLENWKFKNIKIIIENPFAIPTMCYVFIVEKIGFFLLCMRIYPHTAWMCCFMIIETTANTPFASSPPSFDFSQTTHTNSLTAFLNRIE